MVVYVCCSKFTGIIIPFTWRVFRGWERADKVWPCSTRCCFHIASDSEPWPHGSDSCHSRGYALVQNKHTTSDKGTPWTLFTQLNITLLTILCLYSSEASCTAVSQALDPLAYTLLTSSIQYLGIKQRRVEEGWVWFQTSVLSEQMSTTYFVGFPKAMLSSCRNGTMLNVICISDLCWDSHLTNTWPGSSRQIVLFW